MTGLTQRNGYGERGADALLALYLNMPVHQLHDTLGDGHAQTGAVIPARSGGILL